MAPCVAVIEAKGYAISLHPGETEVTVWDAEKDGRLFSADSAEALLGLIVMWEQRGDDWYVNDDEWESFKQHLCEGDDPTAA